MRPDDAPDLRIGVLLVSLRVDGGAEALLRTLVAELADRPYEIEVFTLRDVDPLRTADFESHGIEVHSFPARRLLSPLRFIRLLRKLRARQLDVLHTNLPAANILGLLSGFALRIPVVTVLHNSETKADRHWYHGRLETFLIKHAAASVVAVGDETAVARREVLDGAPVRVLHNAVAPSRPLASEERGALRRSLMSDPANRLAIAVGRLSPQKAHDDLIRAFVAVRCRRSDVELVIVGRGDDHETLRQLIEELGAHEFIHLAGLRTDVRDLLRSSDAFVMSSRWEGLPVALLEAMEAGLPVASTKVGDIAQVLEGGCSVLVPPGDASALTNAISDVLDMDSDACAAVNRTIIEERHSSRAWAREMTNCYDEVNGRRRR